MAQLDQLVRDGNLSFEGGQDAGRPPSAIGRNQVAAAINATVRGGRVKPRPGFLFRRLTFASETVHDGFKSGYRFQHAAFYDGAGIPMLMSSHGGRLFAVRVDDWTAEEITPTKSIPATVAAATTTTADFTVPAVNGLVTVTVASTADMTAELPDITIGGVVFTLIGKPDGTHCVLRNSDAAAVGNVMANPLAVTFEKESTTVTQSVSDPNSALLTEGWSRQLENYWVYQDNQSWPVIFNGAISRRSRPQDKEVPVGNVMAYEMGRLAVGLPDRQSFRVGDLLFSPSGTIAEGYRDAVLRFTENEYLNEGGDFIARVFGAPSGKGELRAMAGLAMNDTSLGQGPLVVGTPGVMFTCNLPFDRTIWKNLQSPIQTVNPILGPVSQDATTLINGDLWYRSIDGVRSYIQAQRQFSQYGNTPMSLEIRPTLAADAKALLRYTSAGLWDNRWLLTCDPHPSPMGVYFRGLAVINFDTISTLNGKTGAAWEGIWTGLKILKAIPATVNDTERLFIYALNSDNDIELWELDNNALTDGEDETPIQWSVALPSYDFRDGFALKCLQTGELFIDNVRGDVTITVKYRPDQYPCYLSWDSLAVCSTIEDCTVVTCDPNAVPPVAATVPRDLKPQFRSKLKLKQPPDTFDEINKRKHRTGYEFQPLLEFTGHCELIQARFLSSRDKESANAERSYA